MERSRRANDAGVGRVVRVAGGASRRLSLGSCRARRWVGRCLGVSARPMQANNGEKRGGCQSPQQGIEPVLESDFEHDPGFSQGKVVIFSTECRMEIRRASQTVTGRRDKLSSIK